MSKKSTDKTDGMPKYKIGYKGRSVFRYAENAVSAIEKVSKQYHWSYKIVQVDADTRGRQWAEAFCDMEGGINYNVRLIAAAETI